MANDTKYPTLTQDKINSINRRLNIDYSNKNIYTTDHIINSLLEEDEFIEKIIKARNLTDIEAMTISSSAGDIHENSNDYNTFDMFYFTNKHIFLFHTNYLNKGLHYSKYSYSDYLDIDNSPLPVEIVEDPNKELYMKTYYPKDIIVSLILGLILFLYGTTDFNGIIFLGLGILLYSLVRFIELKSSKAIKLGFRDKSIVRFLITPNSYEEDLAYLQNLHTK